MDFFSFNKENEILNENEEFTFGSIKKQLSEINHKANIKEAEQFLENHPEVYTVLQPLKQFMNERDETSLLIILGSIIFCFKSLGLKEYSFINDELNTEKNKKEFFVYYNDEYYNNFYADNGKLAKKIMDEINIDELKQIYDQISYKTFPTLSSMSNKPVLLKYIGTYMFSSEGGRMWSNQKVHFNVFIFCHFFINILSRFYFNIKETHK